MTPAGEACPASAHTATIIQIVYLGTVTHYYTRTLHGDEMILYTQNQGSASSAFAVENTMALSWDPKHLLILAET